MAFVLLGFRGAGGRRRRRDPRRRRLMDLGSLEDTHPQLPPHHRIGMPYPSYFSNGGGSAVAGSLGIPNSHLSSSSVLGLAPGTGPAPAPRVRYRECQKNHAASMGGQAVDGCGEFMAAGRDGSAEAFKCAACGCHRNFHRREEVGAGADGNGNGVVLCKCMQREKKGASVAGGGGGGGGGGSVSASKISVPGPQPSPLLEREQNKQMIMATVSSATPTDSDDSTPPPPGLPPSGSLSGARRKRFRTKFTPEQKEVLFSFAETLGWKIQKHDEHVVQEFCHSTGITRSVLKVWLHNNKNTRGKNA